jgi:hypothetical protein
MSKRNNNRVRRPLLIVFIVSLLFVSASTRAAEEAFLRKPPIKVTARADKDNVNIGDKVTYSITASTRKGIDVEFPVFDGQIGDLVIKGFDSQERTFFGKKRSIQSYLLISYKPGLYVIPKAVVKYKLADQEEYRELETAEIEIAVESILEGQKGVLDIRDIKGPVDIRGLFSFLIFGIVVLIILAGITGAYLFTKARQKMESRPPVKPPHIIAYEALQELKTKNLIKEGKVKEYYIGLSDIVRRYLENRFNLRAPEMTTEEFLVQAKDTGELSREHKNLLKDFMYHCDLVKFAKYGPTDSEIGSSSESAKRLIDQTKQEAESEGVIG